ncbi:hypothetical protein ACFQL1_11205 [Halomicroarcula sp. GCM10025709]
MVFVIQQELSQTEDYSEDRFYEYFAYDYGPFSKELAEDIDEMIDADLLIENEVEYNDEGDLKYLYRVDDSGREVAEKQRDDDDAQAIIELAKSVKQRYNEQMSLPEVIDEVYEEYPEYAENSVY